MEARVRRESEEARAERRREYAEYVESGKTVTAYSRERGISPWRMRTIVKKTGTEGGAFQEVKLSVKGEEEYAVVLRNGREIRVSGGFNEHRMEQLIALAERC